MRISKVIARAGLCSRREAERWISMGRVSLKDRVIRDPALNVTLEDRIFVDGVIEGTVESIGFRSTVVRRFDKSLATIPNFQFAENAVINNTQITNRRISWIIGLEYRTTSDQLNNIKKEILDYIEKSEDFKKSGDTLLSVKIDQFAASSIDIKLICYTKTRYYKEWLNVKDKLAMQIKNIVENNKASFAFPSTSIYVEKN